MSNMYVVTSNVSTRSPPSGAFYRYIVTCCVYGFTCLYYFLWFLLLTSSPLSLKRLLFRLLHLLRIRRRLLQNMCSFYLTHVTAISSIVSKPIAMPFKANDQWLCSSCVVCICASSILVSGSMLTVPLPVSGTPVKLHKWHPNPPQKGQ